VLALTGALWRRPALIGLALVALAAESVTLEELRAHSAAALVLYAASLLTLGEVAAFSISLRSVTLVERRVAVRTVAYLAAVAAGAAAVAGIVELATRITIGGGLGAAAIGIGATVALLALTSALARVRGRSTGD
jgi:hypothetical protein